MATTMTSSGFTFGDGSTLESAAPDKTQVGGKVLGLYNGTHTTPVSPAPIGNYLTWYSAGTTGINFVRDVYSQYTQSGPSYPATTFTLHLPITGYFVRGSTWNTSYTIPANNTAFTAPSNSYMYSGSMSGYNSSSAWTFYSTTVSSGSYRSTTSYGNSTMITDPNGYSKAIVLNTWSAGLWQRYA